MPNPRSRSAGERVRHRPLPPPRVSQDFCAVNLAPTCSGYRIESRCFKPADVSFRRHENTLPYFHLDFFKSMTYVVAARLHFLCARGERRQDDAAARWNLGKKCSGDNAPVGGSNLRGGGSKASCAAPLE